MTSKMSKQCRQCNAHYKIKTFCRFLTLFYHELPTNHQTGISNGQFAILFVRHKQLILYAANSKICLQDKILSHSN